MPSSLTSEALDQIFTGARSIHRFLPRPVEEATLRRLYELAKLGPTGFNAQPARFLFIRSEEARQRLAPTLSSNNRAKALAAPLNAIVAWDSRFHEHLPEQFPAYDAKSFFDANPARIPSAGVSNATLQAAYLIVAARALGLDAGPMTGFTADAVDREFFPDGRFRSLLVINLGYGDRSELAPRGPRLAFEDAVTLL
jgi:3-hydroxypropanoate dehydrogenase